MTGIGLVERIGFVSGVTAKQASTLDSARDPALDLVKGLLVLGMIAFHAGVSFIPNTHVRFLILNGLLDFVTAFL